MDEFAAFMAFCTFFVVFIAGFVGGEVANAMLPPAR